jgi:hypothetical protein
MSSCGRRGGSKGFALLCGPDESAGLARPVLHTFSDPLEEQWMHTCIALAITTRRDEGTTGRRLCVMRGHLHCRGEAISAFNRAP